MSRARLACRILAVSQFCRLLAGETLPPEVLAVAHASGLVRKTVAALGNCACLESVARSRVYRKGKTQQEDRDAVQIEVTTIGNREWFSWPGRENGFVQDPASLVGYGLIGAGEFTSDLQTIFLDGFAVRNFRGATTFQRRPAWRFDYSVRSVFTNYILKSQGGAVAAGMQGSFWIDPQTSELLALSSDGTEIPPDFPIRSVHSEMIYAPMYLDDQRVSLPQTASIVTVDSSGLVSSNYIEFSHCHSFSSASSISFDDADSAAAGSGAAPPRAAKEPSPLPRGLTLLLRLASPLTAHSAIGERISATVDAEIRSRGTIIVQKGSAVSGRVRWTETTTCPSPCLAMAIELLTVQGTDGAAHPVYASLQDVGPESKVRKDIERVSESVDRLSLGSVRQTSIQSIRLPEIPGVGTFFVLTPELATPPDMLMTWTTEDPRQ
jgi:hypothetical protein